MWELHYAKGVFGLHFGKTHFRDGTLGTKEQSNEINDLTRNITRNIIKRNGTKQTKTHGIAIPHDWTK
jgi:hypothetical protein